MAHLRGVLGEEPEAKVIVFTEYVDTLEAVAEAFDGTPDLRGTYAILHGEWSRSPRRRAQAGFDGSLR